MSERRRSMMGKRAESEPVEEARYVKFTALESGTFTFEIPYGLTTTEFYWIRYSIDNGSSWSLCSNVNKRVVKATTPTIAAGNSVLWYGSGKNLSNGDSYYCQFSSTCRFTAEGNIMSLINGGGTNNDTISVSYCFNNLFYNCTNLTDAGQLHLPATTLASYCYRGMFQGCTNLVIAPAKLPAKVLSVACYQYMFQNCTSLVNAPKIYAKQAANQSLYQMFAACSALISAPSMSITTLASMCCLGMFLGCTSLVNAPSLPATTLEQYCYNLMFRGCTSLTTAPTLPAKYLASKCYEQMFDGCSSLSYIKAMFLSSPGSSYTGSWTRGVASNGVFVKNGSAYWNMYGEDAIPSRWTVETASE